MACLLVAPRGPAKGVISITTAERDGLVLKDPALRDLLERVKERFVVGLHHNWHDHAFAYDPLFDFSFAGDGDLIEVARHPVPRIDMDACNFSPNCFHPANGEKFWDVLHVSRAVTFKNIPLLFRTIRRLYDDGHRLRVLYVCPMPPDAPKAGEPEYVRDQYDRMFSDEEQKLFNFLTIDYRYPFPFDIETLAFFFRSSRIFIHCSDTERRCRVAGYAWAAGLPVVAQDCVGSLLPAALRREPYFFAAAGEHSFARQCLRALSAAQNAVDWAPVRMIVTEEGSKRRLMAALQQFFEARRLRFDGVAAALEGLDIRLGRHHGLEAGNNAISQPLAAFLTFLCDEKDERIAEVIATKDPEGHLARQGISPTAAIPAVSAAPPDGATGRANGVLSRLSVPLGQGLAISGRSSGIIRSASLLRRALKRPGAGTPIVDRHARRGNFGMRHVAYDTAIEKEIVSRAAILERAGTGMTFLDVGGGNGSLDYLLGVQPGLRHDSRLHAENARIFDSKYRYFCVDLRDNGRPHTIAGDICDAGFLNAYPKFRGFFDVVYSNNAFEHFASPWIAAANMVAMLKPGGLCVTIAPFSLRYHEVPGDYFRFTHTGLASLFERAGGMRVVTSGYDTHDRRVNWQGGGEANDICPVDEFGAWRENWFAVVILEKQRAGVDVRQGAALPVPS